MHLLAVFLWGSKKSNRKYLLELIKCRSNVHQKNMSLERLLNLDWWRSFSENYKPIRVWLWFVYKITETNCRSRQERQEKFLREIVEFRDTEVVAEVFCKKDVLKNPAELTGKHLCQNLFFFLKKETLAQVFPSNFAKNFNNTFCYRTLPVAVSVDIY